MIYIIYIHTYNTRMYIICMYVLYACILYIIYIYIYMYTCSNLNMTFTGRFMEYKYIM